VPYLYQAGKASPHFPIPRVGISNSMKSHVTRLKQPRGITMANETLGRPAGPLPFAPLIERAKG